LGTSAGVPAIHRSTSATLLRMGGSSFLFDAGEGVQRQLAFTRAKPGHIERIFITHLHGDHIFGLPGFLLGLQHACMATHEKSTANDQEQVVKIYGPPGLYNFIAANIVLSCTRLHALTVEVFELEGGREQRTAARNQRNPFEQSYPEFNHRNLRRRSIECKKGIWTIEDFETKTRQDILDATNRKLRVNGRRFRIKAAEVVHVPGVITFGFALEEEEPPRNIDPERAQQMGVSPRGKKYELLKHGFTVQNDDGSSEIQPNDVLIPRTKKARKVVLVGDNRGWTPPMLEIAKDPDVLIHEATLLEDEFVVVSNNNPVSLTPPAFSVLSN
jgi:ribonuclease Z